MTKFFGYKNNGMEDAMKNRNQDKYVISLYDYTGEALKPWAEAGYQCFAFDIQHERPSPLNHHEQFEGGGRITYVHADLHNIGTLDKIYDSMSGKDVTFAMAFPVCTDLAVSGAAHFKRKAERDPLFQRKAANYAIWCAELFQALDCPYFIENPVSVLSTLWRKPDYRFHPYEYGGYIDPEQAEHPKWPDYIAPMDAYPKKTCLWTGGGFIMPVTSPVEPEQGHSRQHLKLGGKSMKTKNIRSATPRGFAQAVFNCNNSGIQRYWKNAELECDNLSTIQ
jgi:hypothetical protein|tara:strand:- start:358 stop:1194 length:837 start_codon:yes stop_codon:yes gene_type:complete